MNMDAVVSSRLRAALLVLAGVVVLGIVAGLLFEAQIAALSARLLDEVGPLGVGLAIGINDLVISPVPPDLVLLVLSKSEAPGSLFGFVAFLGLCSALGGTCAWGLSRRYGHPEWFGQRFKTAVEEHHGLVRRYGAWAVGLAALTPIPFSLVCWIAGFVKLEFTRFAPMALLRIPRFLVYYAVLVFSEEIMSWLR